MTIVREQATKGSLVPGKLANFVVLDRNPLKVDPLTIKDTVVSATQGLGPMRLARARCRGRIASRRLAGRAHDGRDGLSGPCPPCAPCC